MALKSRFAGLHLLFRMLGLTGLMAVIVALVLWTSLPSEYQGLALNIGYGGAAALALSLLVEIRGVISMFGSRRAGLGSNVLLQGLLAVLLVAGLNVWSFQHYRRFDWTWDQSFTLPEDVKRQLAQLRGATDIVVYQKYVSFTQRGDAAEDKYDLAAHKKIVEKVRDLAELFQDLGPRFRVQLLDIQDDSFDAKMKDLNKKAPALATAIEKAPENSIFFHSGGKVQRLAFHDVYQVDKQASQEDNNGQGNLVLNFQGVEPIARKILNIEEKTPRIATAVVHPVLTMSDPDHLYFTMNGAKKVLDAYGFDTKDLLMRKMEEGEGLSPDPAVLTFEESRYEQIEEELALLAEALGEREKDQATYTKLHAQWRDLSLPDLNKIYAYAIVQGLGERVIPREQVDSLKKSGRPFKIIDVDDIDRQNYLKAYDRELLIVQNELDMIRRQRQSLLQEKTTLSADELGEKRRITDVEIKMKRELADRDLLIIPRFTAINIPRGHTIPNRVHKLDAAQIKAVKHFLREGKAVLFLLGPTNESNEDAPFREPDIGDDLEPMLAELGITLPKQTILFNAEAKDYNERKVGVMFAGRETELPAVKFEWQPEVGRRGTTAKAAPHPIRTSLNLTSRSVGRQTGMELKIRHPRPVYVQTTRLAPGPAASVVAASNQPGWTGALSSAASWLGQRETVFDDSAVLFVTSEESWNEEQPFITKKGVPRYEPTKDDDPKKNTPEEERRGPFPIAVAVERAAPATWFDDRKANPKARIAVIGHGGLFTGQTLSPIKEKLLLDTINWLVGRDDLLARQSQPWKYPRVDLAEWQVLVWQMGALFGLPVLFLYFGAMMWLVRSMR